MNVKKKIPDRLDVKDLDYWNLSYTKIKLIRYSRMDSILFYLVLIPSENSSYFIKIIFLVWTNSPAFNW